MLVLTRKMGESILIGENHEIKVVFMGKDRLHPGQYRIGIEANISIPVVREELIEKEEYNDKH